jgi:hypothetical protein
MGESSDVRRYDADFKKVAGALSITSSSIAWVPKVAGEMDRQLQALNRVMGGCRLRVWTQVLDLDLLYIGITVMPVSGYRAGQSNLCSAN